MSSSSSGSNDDVSVLIFVPTHPPTDREDYSIENQDGDMHDVWHASQTHVKLGNCDGKPHRFRSIAKFSGTHPKWLCSKVIPYQ